MPEISRFFGIVIVMYYNENSPPHFHAKYAGQRAAFAISDLRIIEEGLPRRAISLVLESLSAQDKRTIHNAFPDRGYKP